MTPLFGITPKKWTVVTISEIWTIWGKNSITLPLDILTLRKLRGYVTATVEYKRFN